MMENQSGSLAKLIELIKPCLVRNYDESIALYIDYLEGNEQIAELLKEVKWELETDGDFVILWIRKEV